MSRYRTSGALCLVILTYVRPLGEVDAQMDAHVAWLNQGFDHDVLVVAGRQVPRTGGVLLARGERAEIEALAATDPFVTSGVATAQVIAFNASLALPGFTDLAP